MVGVRPAGCSGVQETETLGTQGGGAEEPQREAAVGCRVSRMGRGPPRLFTECFQQFIPFLN